jgi:amino acid adenylation domain-containing protein
MADLPARLQRMSVQERADFLAKARSYSTRARPAVAASPLARTRQTGRSAASFSQEQHWFLDQLWPGDAANIVPFGLRLRGPVCVEHLRAATLDVVRRHDVLRSRFLLDAGKLVQVVDPDLEIPIPVHVVEGATLRDREIAAEQHGVELARAKFDLSNGPLLRVALLVLGPADHLLLWIAHHAVADGWSVGILIEELGTAYRAQLDPDAPGLPALPLQYADFAEWQREQLASEPMEELVARWRSRLADAPSAAVPTDHVRPAVQTFRGETLTFVLPADVSTGIRQLAYESRTTLFVTLLTALHVLVARHSGEPDAVIGAVLTGRIRPEVESLIGPFATTLPIRIDASGDPPFPALLAHVKDVVLDALSEQEIPFGHLVKELGRARDARRNPLYQVLFSMGSLPMGAGPVQVTPDLSVTPIGLPNGTSRLDLEFTMEQTGDRIGGRLDYNTDLYERAAAQRLVDQFQTLLAAIVASPDRPISEFPLLDPEEQGRLLDSWAKPKRMLPPTTFLELFREQVKVRPDTVAVVYGTQTLTYRELDEWSNRIGHAVLANTARLEPVVAVGVGRTLALLPAVLGIIKAGGGYLPLDLEYPVDRLAYMMRDSAADVLITGSADLTELADAVPAVISVDQTLADDFGGFPAGPVSVGDDPTRLVYVMYTSGSTGQPKGVAVQHAALGNFLRSMIELGVMAPGDVTVALASLPFDGSVIELFLPLAVGATLVVGHRADARDGSRLRRLLREHDVTVLHATPSMWRSLLDSGENLAPLRTALSGGEELSADLARELRRQVHVCWNLYGPAETTVYSLAQKLADDSTPLIGPPIANTTAYVLDEMRRPVPPEVLGELWLGGAGVAKGYLHLPELTAARFVDDPRTGDRIYRTGDLFTYSADGAFVFHGRADNQVKLRGHRIELGEIEAVLAEHPAVREAVVLVKEFGADDQRLVAYVRTADEISEGELRTAARRRLPYYMLPARVVRLSEFPLNSSGKVSRKALARLALDEADDSAQYDPPETATQEWLAQLWAESLGRQRIGVHEDFFVAGGHSLLAVKILYRVRDELGVELPVDEFLAAPTIARLSALTDNALLSKETDELVREIDEMTDEQVAASLEELAREG